MSVCVLSFLNDKIYHLTKQQGVKLMYSSPGAFYSVSVDSMVLYPLCAWNV